MASGFSGGGQGADFYGGFGNRSLTGASMSNAPLPTYRSQLSGIFLDPTAQIGHRVAAGIAGKRTLSEFQSQYHQQQQQNQYQNLSQSQSHVLNGFNLRSVKPRIYNHASAISLLSPIEYSGINLAPEASGSLLLQHSYGAPILQQFRSQPIGIGNCNLNSNGAVVNTVQNQVQSQVMAQESEKKMMTKLQELEKELLDDEDEEDGGDAVSVITNTNSEWSETIQSLMNPNLIPISPSPTSSSSSSTSSVATSPATTTTCSKQSLMEVASLISEGKKDAASEILVRLAQAASPRGNSEQRLVDFMVSALRSRLNGSENAPPVAELYGYEHASSTQMLFEMSPCFKLGFMAANQAIIEATVGDQSTSTVMNKIHVVDFDIGQGGQYVNLLHALSGHVNGKRSSLKITTVSDPNTNADDKLAEVKEVLAKLAERVGVTLRFNAVTQPLSDLTRESLSCEPDEPLAVNFAFKLYRMPDESVSTENPRDALLRRVKSLSPRVVTLVEQELNTNTAPFTARVAETSAYYSSLLESISAVSSNSSPERAKLEEGLARRVANTVACEGRDRVERCEVLGKWKSRMCMAGFEPAPLNRHVAESMRARLSSGNRVNPGFTVEDKNGAVCFGWMGRTLTVLSAWR